MNRWYNAGLAECTSPTALKGINMGKILFSNLIFPVIFLLFHD